MSEVFVDFEIARSTRTISIRVGSITTVRAVSPVAPTPETVVSLIDMEDATVKGTREHNMALINDVLLKERRQRNK